MSLVLLLHAFSTFFMTGVIWIVQLVHYPLFSFAAPQRYAEFQAAHMRRITWIVFPAMTLELISGLLLVFRMAPETALLLWGNLALLVAIWLVTALVQVPQHAKLLQIFDDDLLRALVRKNWLRTLFWSLRSIIILSVMILLSLSHFKFL